MATEESAQQSIRPTPSGRLVWATAVVGAAVVAAVAFAWLSPTKDNGGLVASGDFIAYWSGFAIASEGGDPYDPAELLDAQRDVDPSKGARPQRYLNPPWALLPMAPVAALPFGMATGAWLVMGVAGTVGLVAVSWRLFRPGTGPPPASVVVLSFVFLPALESLNLGQLSIFVALVTLGGILALRVGRDGIAGALFAMTVVKPQAVLLVLLVIAVHVVGTRRWRVVQSAVAVAGATIGASAVVFPSAWEGWSAQTLPTDSHSATIAGWLRTAILYRTGDDVTWPIVAVPLVTGIALLPWAWRHRLRLRWDAMPVLFAVSLLAAPNAWVYDGMILLPIQVIAVTGLIPWGGGSSKIGLVAVALQAGAIWYTTFDGADHRHLVLVPVAMLLLAMVMHDRDDFSAEPSGRARVALPLP